MGARGVVHAEEPPEQLLNAIEKVEAGELRLDGEATSRVFNALQIKSMGAAYDAQKTSSLTPKERKVFDAIISYFGTPNKVIAKELFISEATLRHHLTSIYQKLNVGNRMGLYLYAQTHGGTERHITNIVGASFISRSDPFQAGQRRELNEQPAKQTDFLSQEKGAMLGVRGNIYGAPY